MKKIITRTLAGAFLLAVLYLVVADGMIELFDLSTSIQYAFNYAAIFLMLPFGTYFLLGMNEEDIR